MQDIKERATAQDLDSEEYRLVTSSLDVNAILDRLGVDHDPDSIVLEDSYHALFLKGSPGSEEYEVWGCHKATPRTNSTVYKLV